MICIYIPLYRVLQPSQERTYRGTYIHLGMHACLHQRSFLSTMWEGDVHKAARGVTNPFGSSDPKVDGVQLQSFETSSARQLEHLGALKSQVRQDRGQGVPCYYIPQQLYSQRTPSHKGPMSYFMPIRILPLKEHQNIKPHILFCPSLKRRKSYKSTLIHQSVEANLYEIHRGKMIEGKTRNENIAFSLTEENLYIILKEQSFFHALIKRVFLFPNTVVQN